MLKNDINSYGSVARLFHWVMGLIIIGLITVGFTMTSMADSDDKWQLYSIHKALGSIVLILVIPRFLWRLMNIQPALPINLPKWQKGASKVIHYSLYVLMFLMPISGILMSCFAGYEINVFGLFVIPAFAEKNIELAKFFHYVHINSGIGFSVLIGLHIMAGLYHHFVRKDNILLRMIR